MKRFTNLSPSEARRLVREIDKHRIRQASKTSFTAHESGAEFVAEMALRYSYALNMARKGRIVFHMVWFVMRKGARLPRYCVLFIVAIVDASIVERRAVFSGRWTPFLAKLEPSESWCTQNFQSYEYCTSQVWGGIFRGWLSDHNTPSSWVVASLAWCLHGFAG